LRQQQVDRKEITAWRGCTESLPRRLGAGARGCGAVKSTEDPVSHGATPLDFHGSPRRGTGQRILVVNSVADSTAPVVLVMNWEIGAEAKLTASALMGSSYAH
jgi:hypothetical protein